MKRFFLLLIFLIIQEFSSAQNILINNFNNPNEPSIAMDPKHPNVMIAGANIDNYYISLDTGYTWNSQTLTSSYGVWGDPVMAVDTAGSLYFFHLSNPPSGSWIDRIVCQKSLDNGSSWSNGSYTGLNGIKDQDKHGVAIDRRNNTIYLTWTQFDQYGSSYAGDSSNILFSKSTDAGNSWSSPQRINKFAGDCIDSDSTVEGAVPAIGPAGQLYVAWAGPRGLVFNRSLDGGNSWMPGETVVGAMPGGWDYNIPGIYRANGLPATNCDTSNSPYRGTIYINWTDQRNGAANTDVFLCKSTDGGLTWSNAIKVNDDNSGRHQFFTWMTIDQTNGNLYFVFYDRRAHSDDSTDVFVAVSTDGGNTFINHKVSQSPFFPNSSVFFGDYTSITAYNGVIRPVWTRLNNGQLSIWTDITTLSGIISSTKHFSDPDYDTSFENYPNPSHNYALVSFKLHGKSNVSLDLIDKSGKIISAIISNEERGFGKYVERIDLESLNVSSGIYFLRLKVDGDVQTVRQVLIK